MCHSPSGELASSLADLKPFSCCAIVLASLTFAFFPGTSSQSINQTSRWSRDPGCDGISISIVEVWVMCDVSGESTGYHRESISCSCLEPALWYWWSRKLDLEGSTMRSTNGGVAIHSVRTRRTCAITLIAFFLCRSSRTFLSLDSLFQD